LLILCFIFSIFLFEISFILFNTQSKLLIFPSLKRISDFRFSYFKIVLFFSFDLHEFGLVVLVFGYDFFFLSNIISFNFSIGYNSFLNCSLSTYLGCSISVKLFCISRFEYFVSLFLCFKSFFFRGSGSGVISIFLGSCGGSCEFSGSFCFSSFFFLSYLFSFDSSSKFFLMFFLSGSSIGFSLNSSYFSLLFSNLSSSHCFQFSTLFIL